MIRRSRLGLDSLLEDCAEMKMNLSRTLVEAIAEYDWLLNEIAAETALDRGRKMSCDARAIAISHSHRQVRHPSKVT